MSKQTDFIYNNNNTISVSASDETKEMIETILEKAKCSFSLNSVQEIASFYGAALNTWFSFFGSLDDPHDFDNAICILYYFLRTYEHSLLTGEYFSNYNDGTISLKIE